MKMQTDELRPNEQRPKACHVTPPVHRFRELIAKLHTLSGRARRLPPPSCRDPEAFHIARDELAADIDAAAADLARLIA